MRPSDPVETIAEPGTRDARDTPALACEDIWKIYGARAADALDAVRAGSVSHQDVRTAFGCVVAVAGVSFSLAESESFCIMGLSGSGKSTLLRHVNRLIEPTAGQIRIFGDDISKKSPHELRQIRAQIIGMVFQDYALFPHRTVLSNIAYGLEVRGVDKQTRAQLAEEALDLVQLKGWGDRYPQELSGGMQQRVGLARAIAGKPRILLLDEPFGALDPVTRRQLQTEFRELLKRLGISCVFITHDLDEAIRLGDRIAIMREERFVQVGTPEQIVMNPHDDYVVEFVRGISRRKMLRASTVMTPISALKPGEHDLSQLRSVAIDTPIDALVDFVLAGQGAVAVRERDGRFVGIVDCRTLLKSIQAAD